MWLRKTADELLNNEWGHYRFRDDMKFEVRHVEEKVLMLQKVEPILEWDILKVSSSLHLRVS